MTRDPSPPEGCYVSVYGFATSPRAAPFNTNEALNYKFARNCKWQGYFRSSARL